MDGTHQRYDLRYHSFRCLCFRDKRQTGLYGYRPGRNGQDAIRKVKEYAEQGYTQAVQVDLSKYFDTRVQNLIKLGMPQWMAHRNGNSRKGYWAVAGSGILTHTITNERLAAAGCFCISDYCESLHLYD